MLAPGTAIEVAILVFPETTASVAFGLHDFFAAAGRDWGYVATGQAGAAPFRPRIVSARGGTFTAANGIQITAQDTLEAAENAAIVCVPTLAVQPGEALAGRFTPETDFLRRCYVRGATLATACSGTLLFAEAGLLEGWEAATHWAYCDVLGSRYRGVRVHRKRPLVVSGDAQRLVMGGGGTSWQDVALYLIGRFAGIDAAIRVARIKVVEWHAVGQQPFAHLAVARQVEDAVIARCQRWIADHYQEPVPVAAMVRESGLTARSFQRRFREATGMSPLAYVHALRLEEAKQMLEAGDEPVDAIASAVGYEDAGFFSRLFRREVNLTPAQYRRRFGGLRRALQTGR
jgi:transcriptional regulator GlxA family with amidase domain